MASRKVLNLSGNSSESKLWKWLQGVTKLKYPVILEKFLETFMYGTNVEV